MKTLENYMTLAPVQALERVKTSTLFGSPGDAALSPIDRFMQNTTAINLVFVPYHKDASSWKSELGTLVLLGYVSAVESYLRATVAGLINIDASSRRLADHKSVTFAAATHVNSGQVLSEALLENISFSTKGEIEKAFREFLGIEKLTESVTSALDEFKKLCELRHCCVHRFGKLGSQNALRLGIDDHRDVIEHAFRPEISDVEAIADALQTIVKTLNNFLFTTVLDRTVFAGIKGNINWKWAWNYGVDRKRFLLYYNFFAAQKSAEISAKPKDIYDSFRTKHSSMIAKLKAEANT